MGDFALPNPPTRGVPVPFEPSRFQRGKGAFLLPLTHDDFIETKAYAALGPCTMVSLTATTEWACLPLGTQPLPEGPTVRRLDARFAGFLAKSGTYFPSRLCIHWVHSRPCRRKILGFASALKKLFAMNSWRPVMGRTVLPRRSYENSCGSMSLAILTGTTRQTDHPVRSKRQGCRRILFVQLTIMPSCSPMS